MIGVFEHWAVDISWRSVDVALSAGFYRDGVLRDTGNIPMNHTSTSLGVKYLF